MISQTSHPRPRSYGPKFRTGTENNRYLFTELKGYGVEGLYVLPLLVSLIKVSPQHYELLDHVHFIIFITDRVSFTNHNRS